MSGTLTHSPADIIRQMLIDLTLGTDPDVSGTWPVYVSQQPDTPDKLITIYDTTGIHQGREQIGGEVQERHGFQVLVRAANHQDGWNKAREIVVALDVDVYEESVTVSSVDYTVYAVSRTSGPIALGKESPATKRDLFSINATAALRQD